MENPFVLPKDAYKRDLNIVKHYIDQNAVFLAKMQNISIEEAKAFIKKTIGPGGVRAFKDPKLTRTYRPDFADKTVITEGFYQYLTKAIKNKDIISPTLTTYVNPEIRESILVQSIENNVNKRKVNKKLMFKAKMDGNKELESFYNISQTGNKLSNNALSGAQVSTSTPLCNKSSHSTLTSGCRTTSGYGNANNEKMISGNRHYYNEEITRLNIISLITNTDYEQLERCIQTFGLKYPTQEDVFNCIDYSAKMYWNLHSKGGEVRIKDLISRLTPLECAAVIYTGDLYHIRLHNPEFIRNFLTEIITKKHETNLPNLDEFLSQANEDYISLAKQICDTENRGKKLDDLKGTQAYITTVATLENIYKTINKYSLFIRTFFVTENVPASLAYFPSSVRRSALMSDTDSTIFTVQEWVKWYCGGYYFTEEAMGIAATMIFLASQAITHILAMMSANFGVDPKRIHQIAMKNEYKFDVFVPTNKTKHYYALIGCREGNLFSEHELEVKGVHLKSSNVSPELIKDAHALITNYMTRVMRGEKISIDEAISHVANKEREIYEDIRKGHSRFFRRIQIKVADAYKQGPYESQYAQYLLWKDVFAPKYGDVPPPPFNSVKINTTISGASQFKEWLDNMTDKEFVNRIQAYLNKTGKKIINTFYIPQQAIEINGIPEEVFKIIDSRKIIKDNMSVFYLILETFGLYVNDKKNSVLLSDYY